MRIIKRTPLKRARRGPVPAGSQAPTTIQPRNTHLSRITLDDGTRFDLRVAPAAEDRGPIAIVLPALGAPSRFYERFARRLSSSGLTCVTVDLRGQGDSYPHAGPHSTNGYKEIVEIDLPRIISEISFQYPGRAIWLMGHSLGGQLSLVFSGLQPTAVSGLVLIAAGSTWYRGFKGVRGTRNLIGSQLIALISRGLGYWPGDHLGFGGRQSLPVMLDWAETVRTGLYRANRSSVNYETALRKVRVPVHFIEVAGDALAPQGAVTLLSAKVPHAAITRWNYQQQDSSTTKLDHFAWARESPGLAEDIASIILGYPNDTQETTLHRRTAHPA